MKITTKTDLTSMRNISVQNGATLLITIVVMLALTVLALAATNSNQNQALMVRNAQFRMETFNASYTEIEAQIADINTRKISDGVPDFIISLVDSAIGATIRNDGKGTISSSLTLKAPGKADYVDIELTQENRGVCPVFGQQLGAGSEKLRCNELMIISQASLTGKSSVGSDQNQVYEYRTLAE